MKVESFEDACRALQIPSDIPSFPTETGAGALYQLEIITRALNEGWTPDWSDENQKKWYPWFDFQGYRFVFFHVTYYCTDSLLGSRLCYKDEKTAEYAGKTFMDLYKKMLHPVPEEDYSDLL